MPSQKATGRHAPPNEKMKSRKRQKGRPRNERNKGND